MKITPREDRERTTSMLAATRICRGRHDISGYARELFERWERRYALKVAAMVLAQEGKPILADTLLDNILNDSVKKRIRDRIGHGVQAAQAIGDLPFGRGRGWLETYIPYMVLFKYQNRDMACWSFHHTCEGNKKYHAIFGLALANGAGVPYDSPRRHRHNLVLKVHDDHYATEQTSKRCREREEGHVSEHERFKLALLAKRCREEARRKAHDRERERFKLEILAARPECYDEPIFDFFDEPVVLPTNLRERK